MVKRRRTKKVPVQANTCTPDKAMTISKPMLMLILTAILMVCALCMFYKAGDSMRGYHCFNEGHYLNIAAEYANLPLNRVITSPADLNNPPLYLFLLTIVFKIFGSSILIARSLSIAFSIATIYFIYKIGRYFYSSYVGLIAALLLALTPAFQLVGRNVQTESLLLLTMFSSLYFYLISIEQSSIRKTVLAGVLLGLGLLTKLPAMLILFIIIVWHLLSKQKQLLLNRRFYIFLATSLIVGMSWFVYQAIFAGDSFFASQGHLAGTMTLPNLYFFKDILFVELFWALSPIASVLVLVVLINALITLYKTKRFGFNELFLIATGMIMAFFIFFHFHTYYLLPIVPFLMLLTAHFLDEQIKNPKWLLLIVVSVALVTSFFSFAMLGNRKYGNDELEQAAQIINYFKSEEVVLEVSKVRYESYLPALKYLMPDVEIRADTNPDNFPKNAQVFWWIEGTKYSNDYLQKPGVWLLKTSRLSPTVFGYRYSINPFLHPHLFNMENIGLERAPDCLFGMSKQTFSALILVNWSQNGTPSTSEVIIDQ